MCVNAIRLRDGILCFNRHMQNVLHTVYLGFGANLGQREKTLRNARDLLLPAVEVVASSSLYETPPWGVHEQPAFLNAVCEARTDLAPAALLVHVKELERQLGRVASVRWGPRAIDIDILLFDNLVLHSEQLTIPHPHLHQRGFVLVPLAELAPRLQHPVLAQTMEQLVAALQDTDIKLVVKHW